LTELAAIAPQRRDSIKQKIDICAAEAVSAFRCQISVVSFSAFHFSLRVPQRLNCSTPQLMPKQYSAPPPMTIDPNKQYSATFKTSRGEIVCDLFAKDAPKTVNNFVFLAREKFYDGTVFHRVLANFMIQGGDPTGTGRSGPGYQFEDELKSNPRKHQVGSLSMANAGPNTNGSQFFITHVATDWLNGKHTVFGQVRSGQEIVNSIQQGDELTSVAITEE
jgi:peptidyl-prolyl cis-trans isomerase B (cyclophilin B)